MKNYMQKCLSLTAVLLLLLVVLTSCDKRDDAQNNELGDLYEAISQYRDMLEEREPSTDEYPTSAEEIEYVLVIPAGCGAELFDSAAFLSGELSKYVADEVEVVYDCDLKETNDKIEILIGDTDRQASKKFFKELRVDDYGYKYDDGAIVISAHRGSVCAENIRSFLSDIETGKVDMADPEDIQESIVRGKYSVNGIKLNGFELCEYEIVYPADNKLCQKALAERLRDDIAEYSGYYLRVISDKQCKASTRAICVGQSERTGDYSDSIGAYISLNGAGDIELISNDNFGIHTAISRFIDMIKQSESEGFCSLELSGKKQYFYNDDAVSLYIVRNDFVAGSLQSYLAAIRGVRNSSVAVFDRMSDEVRKNLTGNLKNTCTLGTSLLCYENTAEFECVSSKTTGLDSGANVVTLVIKRSDGMLFGVVCGLCEDSSNASNNEAFYKVLVAELQSLGDMPIVVIHELGSVLDRRFADENPHLEPVVNVDGIYYTSRYFKLKSYATEEIASSVFAEKLELEFYYS